MVHMDKGDHTAVSSAATLNDNLAVQLARLTSEMDLVTQRVKHVDCTIETKYAIVSNVTRSDIVF